MVKFFASILTFTVLLLSSAKTFAAGVGAKTASHMTLSNHSTILLAKSLYFGLSALGGGLAIGLGVIGAGAGMGSAVRGALEAMSRNPEMEKKLIIWMITGMAIMESLALYALLITFILFYANPFKGIILG